MEALSVREYRNNLAASFTKADNGEQVLIPFVEDFIVDIDEAEGVIYMDLPAGLVDMSEAEE